MAKAKKAAPKKAAKKKPAAKKKTAKKAAPKKETGNMLETLREFVAANKSHKLDGVLLKAFKKALGLKNANVVQGVSPTDPLPGNLDGAIIGRGSEMVFKVRDGATDISVSTSEV